MKDINFNSFKNLLNQPVPLAIIALTGIFVIVALYVNNHVEETIILFLYAVGAAYLRIFYKGILDLLRKGKEEIRILTRWKIYHTVYYIIQLTLLYSIFQKINGLWN